MKKTTYEKFIEDPKQKVLLDKEYKELLVSELLIAAMKEDHISVRKLAQEAGVSPTVVQNVKSGKKTNITLSTLTRILDVIGYEISFQPKEDEKYRLKHA